MNQGRSLQPAKELPIRALLAHLEKGWRSGHADVARDFANHWKERLNASIEISEVKDHFLHFVADMGFIRFKGTDETQCLVISGADAGLANTLKDSWERIYSSERLTIVLALSQESFRLAVSVVPKEKAVILDPDFIAALMAAPDPVTDLKRQIRNQLPLRRLIPFNTLSAAIGHMFAGRNRLLTRLREETDVGFAVAGPGRIGKTSLLQRYRARLVQARDPRMHSTIFIDCSACADRSADGVARFIALRIESSSRNSTLTADRLRQSFLYWRAHFNRPLELLLDEVDEIFIPSILTNLGIAAKDKLCRVIFAGKSVLLRSMLNKESPLACRLDLLRLEPLQEREAAHLLFGPLQDLGFEIPERQEVLSRIQDLTGNFPHLIQYFGSRLADIAVSEGSNLISPQYVERIRDSFESISHFMSSFNDLSDPRARIVAFAVLSSNEERVQLPKVRELSAALGLPLQQQQVWDICLTLTIHNILTWDNGAFRLANKSLRYYARQSAFLDGALKDAKNDLAKG